ncbi:MAG: hypothetical protein ACPG49_13935, partial [Chitinophagales bacterium]
LTDNFSNTTIWDAPQTNRTMNLPNAVKKVFEKRTVTNLKDFYKKVKSLTKKRLTNKKIEEVIDEYWKKYASYDIAINWNDETIIYREQLFHDTQFRINLTEQEIDENRLYVGHRFQPFIHPEVALSDITLQDEDGNPIPLKTIELPIEEIYIYISLLAPYSVNQPQIKGMDKAVIAYYDLQDWLADNDFQEKDALLIVPIDYEKHIFQLEKMTSREIATQTFVTQNKDKQLTEAIEDILNWYSDPMPVDVCLFWAYAISKPALIENPGTPFGPFISSHEDFTFHSFSYFTFIHYHNYEQQMMEEALLENQIPELKEAGKAKDINGIFEELGNSFSEDFVRGHIVQQLHKDKEVNKEEILSIIFKENHLFRNKKQAKNFEAALEKLTKNLQKEWKTKRLAPALQRLLNKTLDLKITIVNGLREIDANLTNIEDLDMQSMAQLTQFDTLSEQILHFMFHAQNEEQELTSEFATNIISNVEQMKENFELGLEYVLAQL